MKKIIILSFILTVVIMSVQAQRHGGGRGGYRGGYSYHGGGYGYRGGGYGYSYGRPYVGFGLGLALGAYINPYYGYAYPPYAYGYPYASPYAYPYPPAYVQPPQYPQQYQYNNPPQSYDSSGRAPQPGNPGNNNNDGGYNQAPPQSANGDVADNGQGPKPQKIWVASHWTHRTDGWVWVEGYWK